MRCATPDEVEVPAIALLDRTAEVARPTQVKRQAVSWAQRLKRVFRIEIARCGRCGGAVKVIAAIEEPAVIERILRHLGEYEAGGSSVATAGPRGPPV